jgi:hypothetical protein
MRNVIKSVAVAIGCSTVFCFSSLAQDDLGKQLSKMARDNAPNYLTPLLSGLGADLNSGFYHSADLHDILGFDIGVKLSAAVMKDEDKTFDFLMPPRIPVPSGIPGGGDVVFLAGTHYPARVGSPTAVGEKNGVDIYPTTVPSTTSTGVPIPAALQNTLKNQKILTTPPGFNLKGVPLIVPQASVGLPLGIEVIGRFIPTVTIPPSSFGEPVGKVNFIGFGLRHDIDQYIPLCPIDIAVHFMTQKLTISDNNDNKILSGKGTAYGVEVSKGLALLTLYGGFQLEKSSWDLEPYKFSDPSTGTTVDVKGFSVEGKNKSRFHAGVRLLLLIVNIHADYSFASQPVITAGVGITLR